MRLRDVKEIKNNEVLARPVYTDEKGVLMKKGTVLKKEYIDLLISIGVESVEIEDPYEIYEDPHFLFPIGKFKNYSEKAQNILENHIYTGRNSLKRIELLAKEIVQDLSTLEHMFIIDYKLRNPNLYEHTVMVTILSVLLADKIKLSMKEKYEIAVGCLLHDLGLRYITVPYVNHTMEEYQPAEVFEFKKHTILAYSVLEEEKWISEIARTMILSHHEKMDGSGFPLKQKNQEIQCKIIQLCDTIDCMVSGMECKRKYATDIIQYINDKSGYLYEKNLVTILTSYIAKYPVGTQIETEEGDYALVISQTNTPDCPKINMLSGKDGSVMDGKIYNLENENNIIIKKVIE